jgi:hypothetical protein
MPDNYAIVIDTNALGDYKKGNLVCKNFKYLSVGKFIFLELIKYIRDNNLSDRINLVVPKIVLEELKEQQKKEFHKDIKKLDANFAQFSELEGFNIRKPTTLNYEDLLSNTSGSFMRTHNIKILDYPDNSILPKLINKAIKKYKPFYKRNDSDSGFKDAILWESLLHYAKNNNTQKFILFSDDSDFNEEHLLTEFRTEVGTDLQIKQTLAEVKSFVEEVVNQNNEFNEVLKLVSLNLTKLYQFLKSHMRSVLSNGSSHYIIDFKIFGDVKDIKIAENISELFLLVNIIHENDFTEHAKYSGEYYYVPDEYSDTLKLTIQKEDDNYNIIKLEFLSERIQTIQNILLKLDVGVDS